MLFVKKVKCVGAFEKDNTTPKTDSIHNVGETFTLVVYDIGRPAYFDVSYDKLVITSNVENLQTFTDYNRNVDVLTLTTVNTIYAFEVAIEGI